MANMEGVRSENGAEGGDNRSTRCISERDEWIVQLEEEFLKRKNENVHRERQCMFFSVPKPFLESFEHFYIPDMVSIGPRHFSDPRLRSIQPHKVEAMCRMESRIQKVCPQRTLKSIVEGEIMGMEKWIRDCYEDEISYSSIDLAWIVTADACFIYEFILSFCSAAGFVKKKWIDAAKYDSIFNSCIRSPTWKRIVLNLLLSENQIPLSVVELLVEIGTGSEQIMQEKLHNQCLQQVVALTNFLLFDRHIVPPSVKGANPHLLGIYYHSAVGKPEWYYDDAYEEQQLSSSLLSCLKNRIDIIIAFGKSCLGFRSSEPSRLHTYEIIFQKLPSATVLKKKGVKFQCVSSIEWTPIQCIGFDEKTSTLRLPQVHVDGFRIALMRNFIALEATNSMYAPYPMICFAMFMNELIDNGDDCRLLSEAGIIDNSLGSDEDVANAFNSIRQAMGWLAKTCKSTYRARAGLHKYLGKRHKILLSEFYSTYLSRPWQIVGLIAATLLLIMTVLQVVCLFATCNP